MSELLSSYSISEIIIILITVCLAIKGLVSFYDWGKQRVDRIYNKEYQEKEDRAQFVENIKMLNEEREKINETLNKFDDTFKTVNQQIGMLIDSDKEAIKSFIVKEHHTFVYDRGWIDDYSLECIERRFAVYKQEHGNSFVEGLMDEIRELPKQSQDITQ